MFMVAGSCLNVCQVWHKFEVNLYFTTHGKVHDIPKYHVEPRVNNPGSYDNLVDSGDVMINHYGVLSTTRGTVP